MTRRLRIAGAYLLLPVLVLATAAAQTDNEPTRESTEETVPTETSPGFGRSFPGLQKTLVYVQLQKRFDSLYEQKRYREAYEILIDDLVWRGDKHAQYMTGIMHWYGQGMPVDKVKGCAWFRLAAQRGNEKLMAVRDEAMSMLTSHERELADTYFREIRTEYGDRKVIKRLIHADKIQLRASMTRHPTLRLSNLKVILDDTGRFKRGTEWHDDIVTRMIVRMEYLEGYVELGELELIDDALDKADIPGNPTSPD